MKLIIINLFLLLPFFLFCQDASIFFFQNEDAILINEKSVIFSSGTEHVDCSNDSSINTTEYSLSFWFKGTSTSFQYLIFRDSSYRVFFSGAVRFEFFDTNGSGLTITSSSGFNDGNWHHVVCVFGAVNDAYLYVDGVLEASRTVGFSNTANIISKDLYLGNNYSFNRDFQGNIDEYAYFNKKLEQADVTRLFNNGVPTDLTAEAGIVMWLRMGDGDTFPTLLDNIGSNNGTMINMDSSDIVTDTAN